MTHNTREVVEEIVNKLWAKGRDTELHKHPFNRTFSEVALSKEDIRTVLHQELQKAREEAVTKFASGLHTLIERGNAETAMNIIRRQSQLDQPNK